MNTPENNPLPETPAIPPFPATRRRKGVALILVISFVVLLSALVVGFFSRVTTDLASSRSYAEGVTVRQLADSAVGVVMGQIREATTVPNGCWGSQPGMIRVYRTAGGQPGPNAFGFYKLYSSHDLIVSDREIPRFDPTQTVASGSVPPEVPLGAGGWRQQPAFFTDLNEPVDIPDPNSRGRAERTIKRYPIFDPSVAKIPALSQFTGSDKRGSVEGCEVTLPQQDMQGNMAPMPVRWIYVLKDGTLTAPTPLTSTASGDSGLLANWQQMGSDGNKTGVPTKENPIVGRIAFWTDDETCKVNINTAGGFLLPDGMDEDTNLNYIRPTKELVDKNPAYYAGSFWDTPRVQTYFDRGDNNADAQRFRGGLANSQPGQNEFQRYPGHPSTTSLGLVMRHLLPPGLTQFNSEKLYAMTPRLMPGGSKNGTVRLETQVDLPLDIKASFESAVNKQNSYHLFGTVDEFFYSTRNGVRRSAVDGINDWVRTVTGERQMRANAITPTLVDQSRFFLTAHSRAPELNLFGRPRVAVWPVPTELQERPLNRFRPAIRNAKDDLIRFCSTVGRNPDRTTQANTRQGEFIFDRENPYSATADFNLPRNREVFSYLRDLTSSNRGVIPGFGGSFEAKYAGGQGGRDQILTEIFDYIRTVNQKDGSRERTIDERSAPRSAENNQLKAATRYAPHALVVPTRAVLDNKPVSGFGRFPTISEASIVFYHGGYVCRPKANSPLAKADLPLVGSARSEGNNSQVVIYDLTKIPWDPNNDPTLQQAAVDWAKDNVEEWTGQLIRAFLIFETFNPMQGYAPVDNFTNISLTDTTGRTADGRLPRYNFADPNRGIFVHEITRSSDFSIQPVGAGGPMPLGLGAGVPLPLKNDFKTTSGQTWGGRNFGGTEGFFHTMIGNIGFNPALSNFYRFQTACADPVRDGVLFPIQPGAAGVDSKFNFSGGEIDLLIRYEEEPGGKGNNAIIQTVKLNFPQGNNWPTPKPDFRRDRGGFDPRTPAFDTDNETSYNNGTLRWSSQGGWAMAYSLPSRIRWAAQQSNSPWGPKDNKGNITGDGHHYANRFLQVLQPGDTIRSLVVGGDGTDRAVTTDPRVAALQQTVENTTFGKHPNYDDQDKRRAQTLRFASGGLYFDPSATVAGLRGVYAEPPSSTTEPVTGSLVALRSGVTYRPGFGPDLISRARGQTTPFVATRSDGGAADFDTGIGSFPDGAFCGKADEGNVAEYWTHPVTGVITYVEPYFSTHIYDPPLDTYFSPNRQIPGPVMFGSLLAPQGPWDRSGWKTLLFCPNPAGLNHPGAQSPHDHLLLDLFTMPVVEPYAISEPFSTAGKVNMNYQMVPFGYIERSTALRAALHPVRVTAIPQDFVTGRFLRYKGQANDENFRYLVDRDETIKAFNAFFEQYKRNKNSGFFKSATEICERYLYPKGRPVVGPAVQFNFGEGPIRAFWENHRLTGDNVREKPYADLYPRLTTKSNTYTVHYRVQTVRQRPFTGAAGGADAYYRTFDEGRDQVLAEYRGHTTIERYLDPEDPRFSPTYTPGPNQAPRINVQTQSLEDAYRFRIISNKRFSPW